MANNERLSELRQRLQARAELLASEQAKEIDPELLEAAQELLGYTENVGFNDGLVRHDRLGRSRVDLVLASGVRSDYPNSQFVEEVIYKIVRGGPSYRPETGAEIVGRIYLDHYDAGAILLGYEWKTQSDLRSFLGDYYHADGYEFHFLGCDKEEREWSGYLERSISTSENLVETHGPRIEEMLEALMAA